MIAWKVLVGISVLAGFVFLSGILISLLFIALGISAILAVAYLITAYLLPMLDKKLPATQAEEKERHTP